jgi:glycosyltransferase involved in cell wall biosynthesis
LASCILPTADRPGFFQQALRCYLRQSYADRELIVVDDGKSPVGEFCKGLPGVTYIRLAKKAPLGAKLNLGIEHARGSIVQKLDDDDYYHPDFLRLAVSHLPARPSERTIVAWCCFMTLFAGCPELRHSGHGWKAGGTLCFYRKLWERRKFRNLPRAVDSWFLRDHQPRLVRVCAPEHYILVRHGGNTWTEMDVGSADDYLRALPLSPKRLNELVLPADLRFYRSISATASVPQQFRESHISGLARSNG